MVRANYFRWISVRPAAAIAVALLLFAPALAADADVESDDISGAILELSQEQDQDAFDTVAELLRRNMTAAVSLLDDYSLTGIDADQPDGDRGTEEFEQSLTDLSEELGYDFLIGGSIDWSDEAGYEVSLFVFDRGEETVTGELTESAESLVEFFDIAETMGAGAAEAVTGEVIAFGALEFSLSGYESELEVQVDGQPLDGFAEGAAEIPAGDHELEVTQIAEDREFTVHRETVAIAEDETTTVDLAVAAVPDDLRLERNSEAHESLREQAGAGDPADGDPADDDDAGSTVMRERYEGAVERVASVGSSVSALEQIASQSEDSQPLPYEGVDLISSYGSYFERAEVVPEHDLRMVHVEIPDGGITFPMGRTDGDGGEVDTSFWISDTYVTRDLWDVVAAWAGPEVGQPEGKEGEGKGDYDFNTSLRDVPDGDYPVKGMTWRSAIAWSNALTEWYNAHYDAELTPVYYRDSDYEEPIREVSREQRLLEDPGDDDNPYVRDDADGFRMVGTEEWELAARYIGSEQPEEGPLDVQAIFHEGVYWAPGNYVSGAYAPAVERGFDFEGVSHLNPDETDRVARYFDNTDSVQPVATRDPNWLGLYDMAGNLREKVFEWHHRYDEPGTSAEGSRIVRGGGYNQENLGWSQVGHQGGGGGNGNPYAEGNHTFRVARTATDGN